MKRLILLLFLATPVMAAYSPPIGIPAPSFGIDETYRIYDTDPGVRNGALAYVASPDAGFFTHYVDEDHGAATDTDNLFGSEAKPRLTIPVPIPAGSVVEVHNGINDNGGWYFWHGLGTEASPIFIRGVGNPVLDPGDRIRLGYDGNTQYLIFEGFVFWNMQLSARNEGAEAFDTTHVSIRNNECIGTQAPSAGGGIWLRSSQANNELNNCVIYNNSVHDMGEWDPLLSVGDDDVVGILGGDRNVNTCWVLDNTVYHCESNGITAYVQVEAETNAWQATCHHIYIGRNLCYQNKQAGIWAKWNTDCVYSENTVWGNRNSASGRGGGMGFQYAPDGLWLIFNKIYDCEIGINISGDQGGGGAHGAGTEFYLIGNLIYDIKYDETYHLAANFADPAVQDTPYNSDVSSSNASPAIKVAGFDGGNGYVIGNTIYDTQCGINITPVAEWYLANNIISEIVFVAEESHIWSNAGASTNYYFNNLAYDTGANPRFRIVDTVYSESTVPGGVGTGNVTGDPLFADAGNNNYSLATGSPAIDAGLSSGTVDTIYDLYYSTFGVDIRKDIEGNHRSGIWEIGTNEAAIKYLFGG